MDRELLEWAAKAAGIVVAYVDDRGVVPAGTREDGPGAGTWNPLTDDGDALRLAVKLRLDIEDWGDGDLVRVLGLMGDAFESRSTDPYAATRLAITRAAAEIGKSIGGVHDGSAPT